MNQTFLIIDTNHLFWRARHSVQGDDSEKAEMCVHVMMNILYKTWNLHHANHVVFCFDGYSWRKDIYIPYKATRLKPNKSVQEIEEQKIFSEAFKEFKNFLIEKTNVTVLCEESLESDDLIAGFIENHPNDKHIIVSGDGDFIQLLKHNVIIFDGIQDRTITSEGIFDRKGNLLKDKKTGEPLPKPDPEWSIFEKCIRGCTSDNIFSAYPGVRKKGSKNKVGLLEAYEDRNKQGFNWNALMLHRWMDHNGIEHRVIDDYKRNRMLIDLKEQPSEIKENINKAVTNNSVYKKMPNVGINFLKFCKKFDLRRIENMANSYVPIFNSAYPYQNNLKISL